MNRYKVATYLIAAIICNLLPAFGITPNERLAKLQEQLDNLRLQDEFLNLKLKDTRVHVRKLEKQIAEKQERIKALQANSIALASESAQLKQQIYELEMALQEGRKKMALIQKRFCERLVHLHKIRQGILISSIFSANDLNSFLNRFQMIRYLLQADRKLLQTLRFQADKLTSTAQELAAKQKRQDELMKLNQRSQNELTIEMNSLSAMIETLLLERKVFLARQEKLKQTQASLEREIARIEATRSRHSADVEPSGESNSSPASNVAKLSPPQAFLASNSIVADPRRIPFRWPVKYVLPQGVAPTSAGTPPGLEIAIRGETEILAAAKGKVLFKGPLGQFGNIIILGHKQGFSTVYGNLDDIWVGLGQEVDMGEVIGRILGTRKTTLHFEIRFVGRHQDPLLFLPRQP